MTLDQKIVQQRALVQQLATRYAGVQAHVAADRTAVSVARARLREVAVHHYTTAGPHESPVSSDTAAAAQGSPVSSDTAPAPQGSLDANPDAAVLVRSPNDVKVPVGALPAAISAVADDEQKMVAVAANLRWREARAEAELARLTSQLPPTAGAPTSTSAAQPVAHAAPPTTSPPPPPPVYENPLRGISNLVPERIDQGVDYHGSGPIYAVGSGVVLSTWNYGWPGGAFISYRLTDGPAAGLIVYAAEDIEPRVSIGDTVGPDTVLGTMYEGSSGIETGWADQAGDGETMARHTGQWVSEDISTAFGYNFSQFLTKLGAPSGLLETAAVGSLPSSWPTW